MAQQISQLKVFTGVIKALDAGKYSDVKQAELMIQRLLLENRKQRSRRIRFCFSMEEATFVDKLFD